jgi:hypothetical protein
LVKQEKIGEIMYQMCKKCKGNHYVKNENLAAVNSQQFVDFNQTKQFVFCDECQGRETYEEKKNAHQ